MLGLKDGVFLMFDRETDSVWTHFEGKALEGQLAGAQMPLIPLQQMEWGEWKERRPDTLVLAANTGFENRYREVRPGFATGFNGAFVDERLPPNAIVIGVRAGDQDRAYPVDLIAARSGMLNDELAGMPSGVTYDAAAAGGLAYSRTVDGEVLTFEPSGQAGAMMRDVQTGSIWNSSGTAIDGPMSGRSLE